MKARVLISIVALLALVGCATPGAPKSQSDSMFVVENYFAALNRRDALALIAYVSPDVEWFSMVGGERVQEVSGREALVATLKQYFERTAETKWKIEGVTATVGKLAVTERSEWTENGATQSRTTLGVFELDDGRIRRITYFLDR